MKNPILGDNAFKQTRTIVAYHDQKEKSVYKNCHTIGGLRSARMLTAAISTGPEAKHI
jgi:hypothetical protein